MLYNYDVQSILTGPEGNTFNTKPSTWTKEHAHTEGFGVFLIQCNDDVQPILTGPERKDIQY
jgi:hypothetical protein